MNGRRQIESQRERPVRQGDAPYAVDDHPGVEEERVCGEERLRAGAVEGIDPGHVASSAGRSDHPADEKGGLVDGHQGSGVQLIIERERGQDLPCGVEERDEHSAGVEGHDPVVRQEGGVHEHRELPGTLALATDDPNDASFGVHDLQVTATAVRHQEPTGRRSAQCPDGQYGTGVAGGEHQRLTCDESVGEVPCGDIRRMGAASDAGLGIPLLVAAEREGRGEQQRQVTGHGGRRDPASIIVFFGTDPGIHVGMIDTQ